MSTQGARGKVDGRASPYCHCKRCIYELVAAYDVRHREVLAMPPDVYSIGPLSEAEAEQIAEEVFAESALEWLKGTCRGEREVRSG